MFSALFTGFFLGLALIVAIGAQNAFVLRQGILKEHIFYIALFCSLADSLLIIIGILGISYFFENFIFQFSKLIYGLSAIWLFFYGILRFLSAIKANSYISHSTHKSKSLLHAISTTAIFTFANPHVYLDTIVLIGSISSQFFDLDKIYFGIGACFASFIWFFGLGYGAKTFSPLMQNKFSWKILDFLIALIMFVIAFNLLIQGNWL